jgi:4-oxalocrotonate tautomerase
MVAQSDEACTPSWIRSDRYCCPLNVEKYMPFANFKIPQAALSRAQKEELVHRTTAMFVDYFGELVRPYTMVLIEEVSDGGSGRADEVFVVPSDLRAAEGA